MISAMFWNVCLSPLTLWMSDIPSMMQAHGLIIGPGAGTSLMIAFPRTDLLVFLGIDDDVARLHGMGPRRCSKTVSISSFLLYTEIIIFPERFLKKINHCFNIASSYVILTELRSEWFSCELWDNAQLQDWGRIMLFFLLSFCPCWWSLPLLDRPGYFQMGFYFSQLVQQNHHFPCAHTDGLVSFNCSMS